MKTILAIVIGVHAIALLSACAEEGEPRPPAAASAATTMASLVAFARSPSDASWRNVPFAETVELGLADDLIVERTAQELRDPGHWTIAVSLFRGRSATVSALEMIATEQGMLTQSEGEHPHCASPAPVPPPPSVARLRRIWVQPADPDGCLDWWTVDAFVNSDGEIEAVTLDLWEP